MPYSIPKVDSEGNLLTREQARELIKANPEKYLVKPESEDSTPVPMPRYGGDGSTRTSTPVPMPRYGGDGSTRTSTPVPMPRYGDGTLENRGPVDSYGYPIDTSRPIIGDGSTEKNITIEVDGKHVVIPSIWEGQDYSENHQVAINKAKEQGLNTFPSFPTAEEAVAYSKQRSNDINNVRGKDLEAYRSTRRVPTPYQDTHSGDTTGHSTTQMTPLPDANPAIPNDFSGDMTGPSTTIGPREELRMVPATESLPDSSPAGLPPTSDESLGGVPLQNMPYTAGMDESAKNAPSFSAQEMPFTPFPSSGDETPSEADLLNRIQEYFKQPKTVDNPRYVPDGSENTFEDPRYVPDGDTTVEPMLSIPEALLESTKTFENTTGTLGVHSDAASRKPLQNLGYGLNINDPTSRSIFRDIMGEAIEPYLSGQKTLTEPQAEMLTLGRLELAMQEVGRRVDNFDSLPRPWQMGLTDMSYNLGSTRLGAIPGFIRAINQRDQQGALEALTQSNYYKDSRKEGLGGLKDRVDRNISWFMEEPLSYEVSEQAPPNFPVGSPYDSQGNFVGNPEDTLTEYKPGVYGTLAQEMGELFGNTYKSHHYVNEAMSLSDWTSIGDIILGLEGAGEIFSGNFTEGTNLIGLAVGGSLAPYPAQKVKRMYKDMQKKSQVKDENGELLKVYHGTNREVNEFQNKGYGIFFTESPKDAASFGRIHGEEGLNVGEFHLNIEDLYDFSDPNHTELARDWLEENVDDFFITDDPSTLMDALKRGEYSILEHPGFIEDVIQKNGFDGALVAEYPGAKPNYMVFDDSQALPTTFANANKARVPDVPKKEALPSGRAARGIDVPDRIVNTPHIRQDQPHGEWLRYKRQYAIEDSQKYNKPMVGVATAHTKKPVMLPTEELWPVEGFRGEMRVQGDAQFDALLEKVKKEGWSNDSPILLGIAYDGKPYIIEGNTRVAVANRLGIKEIPVEVRWYDGGELVESSFSPERVEAIIAGKNLEPYKYPEGMDYIPPELKTKSALDELLEQQEKIKQEKP